MNFTYLKYFFDAVRLGGITLSAKANFVTQSAISQGIKKLEGTLKRQLITHKRNNIKLTREGELLFQSCKELFLKFEELNNLFENEQKIYRGKVEFACFYSVAVSLLPDAIAKFHKFAPEVTPVFVTGGPDIVKDALKKGKVEFGILMDQSDLFAYDHEVIRSGYFKVYESVSRLKDAPIENCIFAQPMPEVHTIKSAFKKNYGKDLATHLEVTSWEVAVNLVISNVGVSFFPDYLAEVPYREKLIRESNLTYDPIPYSLYAVKPKNELLSKNAQLFLQCLKVKR